MSRAVRTPIVTDRFRAMDSEIVVILPPGQARLAPLVHELFDRWEARLSRFRPDSDLSLLNRSGGRLFETREPLTGVLRQALRAAAATGGIFDPTLGRELVDAGYSGSFADLGGEVSARSPGYRLSSWRDVRIGALGVVSAPPDLAFDLGGIAKGMAVDAAIAALESEGAGFALVSAGGDLAVSGPLPGDRPWPVAVPGEQVVTLTRGAVATSSTERRRWRAGGRELHHLLDPRTRRPARSDLVCVTVHAGTCEEAEVAAKTALILGSDGARRFLDDHGLAGLLHAPGGAHRVGAWPAESGRAA